MKETYQKKKREHKAGRHISTGETGSAVEGHPATAQAAIDAATEAWPLFSQFHTAFGPVQRLRDDTYVETCSPFKSAKPADKLQAESAAATDPSSRAPRAAAKKARVAVSAAVSTVASEDGDPDFVVDDQQENLNPSAQEQIAEADEKSSGTIVYPRKRGRTAARDVQLASQVANDRMADCDDPKLA
jgi:hypothetical protein